MPNSVPCRKPYTPRSPRDGSANITLQVGRGSERTHFTASVEILRRGSEYFYDRLYTHDPSASHLPLTFPSESPAIFNVFLTFLTTGELRHPNLRSTSRLDIALDFIVELFDFSAEFSATTFRNALLDAFFLRLASARRLLVRDIPVREVYASTSSSSSLRDMLATIVVNTGNAREVEKYQDELPKAFFVDCLRIAAEDGIVPFEKGGRGVEEWMEGKKERICEEYHVHDEDMVDEGMLDDGDDKGGDGDQNMGGGGDSGGREESEASEKTKRELAFIEEMRKLRIRN